MSVAIPASLVSDVPHLREKTSKIGLIGRALAIFRVDEVVIYPDELETDQRREINLIATILAYMETPQYLRRRLFKIRPELRYAGILPPLRTPHHPLTDKIKKLKVGEFREGVVVSQTREGSLVDIGVEEPALIPNLRINRGVRVTVKVLEKEGRLRVGLADPRKIETYWGYTVRISRRPLGRMTREGGFDLVIATSRWGDPLNKVLDELRDSWRRSRKVLIAFGAPARGLREILAQEDVEMRDFADFVVNTIPKQATETVRTEEALYVTLSIFNLLLDE